MTPRIAAYETLLRCEKEKQYSNIAINNALKKYAFEKRDRDFYTQLVYGVIERKLTLDYIVKQYTGKSVGRLDLSVLIILRLSLYQIYFLDKIPASAAVSEGVKLAARFASRAKGYVNAILRKASQNQVLYPTEGHNPLSYVLSIRYSVNEEIVKLLLAQYPERTPAILDAYFNVPTISFQINSQHLTPEEFITRYELDAKRIIALPFGVKMDGNCSLSDKPFLENGEAFVQDVASQLTTVFLDPEPSDVIIDVCSCPGGKSFSAANMMLSRGATSGRILSCDLHESKLSLVQSGADRLGYSFISTICHDATVTLEECRGIADKVICDVPCSGLGVIAKKPEIRYKDITEINALPSIQYNILETAATYLKSGGTLLYSTCTVNRCENEEVVNRFLKEHTEFSLELLALPNSEFSAISNDRGLTLFPSLLHDGFFMAKLIKAKKPVC